MDRLTGEDGGIHPQGFRQIRETGEFRLERGGGLVLPLLFRPGLDLLDGLGDVQSDGFIQEGIGLTRGQPDPPPIAHGAPVFVHRLERDEGRFPRVPPDGVIHAQPAAARRRPVGELRPFALALILRDHS